MPTEPSDGNEPRDIVTEASNDSFPASDPPGWIHTRAAASEATVSPVEVVDISEPSDPRPSATSGPHLRRFKRLAIASGIALAAGAITMFFVVRSRRRALA